MKRAVYILVAGAAVACGGAGGGARSGARSHGGGDKGSQTESIGDLAAAQGGLSALGGAGNREEGATGIEAAMAGVLRADEVDRKRPVKLDGVLKEWHDRASGNEKLSGEAAGRSLGVAVQYDADRIYVAGEVTDPKLARTSPPVGDRAARRHAESEDHVSMVLAFPAGRGSLKGYEIGLWAGKPGETAGAVKWKSGPNKGQDVAGAKIVENDAKGGYTFEAAIPWASFPEARTVRVGLRAAFRYHDADAGGVHGVIGTGPGDADKPGELAPLPTAPEQSVALGLLARQDLAGTPPRIDVFSDVAGDERKERISVFGKFFTICGPGFRGGHQFFWRAVSGELTALETRDVTGRGKDDLVVRRRFANGPTVHEILEIWSLSSGDEPQTIFAHEIAVVDGKRRVSNSVRVSAKEIEVGVEPAAGWDASSFKEPPPSDVEPLLLPWGNVKSRVFLLEKGKFAKASEVPQAAAPAPAPATAGSTKPEPLPRDVPTPPTPEVKKGSDLGKQVLEAYYKDAGVAPGAKPRFDLEVHVDGDGRPERVLLVGRDVVVLGPGFKNGTGYGRLSLTQFGDDKDVSELTARDLTGDGAAEIIVRGTRKVSAQSGDQVDVAGLFVYQVRGGALARVFSVETGRESGAKRVQGLVQFVPAKGRKGFEIDVRPGAAKGWTEKTYPWPEDKPGGSIEPLLLPWGKIPSLRYAWNGSQFETSTR